jgi:ABC-2 type transport system ATP-binding protein
MTAENASPALEMSGIAKHYGSKMAVEELSLVVNPGEIFGLIGPDGAGKTTAMRIACGLVLPDAGKTRVMGFDPVRQPLQVRERIGYMPQRFSLYPDLTIAENIRFFADLYRISPAEREAREERLMQFSRLAPFRSRRAGRLSGGMKQKLALSCTLIHTPQVLILDEPTTGVDPVSRREFWTMLRELASDGIALLVSTPYMDEAALCDHIALMNRGRAIATGSASEITAQFPGRLLGVYGTDIVPARKRLEEREFLGIRVLRFGDSLHIVFRDPSDADEVRRELTDLSVDVRPIPPGIEDVFLVLMNAAIQ